MTRQIIRARRYAAALAVFTPLVVGTCSGALAETGLTAQAVSAGSIRLERPGGTRVSVERQEGAGSFQSIAVLEADQRTHLDDGLAEGTTYTYRLKAATGARYDFGPADSPAEGRVRVRFSDRYTPEKGYGIVPDPEAQAGGERNRSGRAEPRLATLVYQSPKLTFAQDLPDGDYLVSLASGDAQYKGSASVTVNGREVVGLINTEPGNFVSLKHHPVTVTDGKLTVEIGGHGRLNCLEIRPQTTESPVMAEASAKTFSLIPSPGEATYYVDAAAGDDANAGTAPAEAWKSLRRINGLKLAPGDRVLLRAGGEFTGPLVPQGSGAEDEPIIVDRFGEGANPLVHGEGKVENTIRLHNQRHWTIRNLTVTNTDGGSFYNDEGRAIRRAFYITAEDAGDVEGIHLENLEIREVRGMYYRYDGSDTNGGIICRVLGNEEKTRFVDLRIEDCVFRTLTIERYPVVGTSSWGKEHPSEFVWKNNTLDHAGRAHIVIPAEHWPREKVYYYDPEANEVFALDKHAPPVSPLTGRVGCEDIFSEIAARLRHSWTFFEATRVEAGRWLFSFRPGDEEPTTAEEYDPTFGPTGPLAYYGELRAMGFMPPWLDPDDKTLRQREDAILEEWVDEMVKLGVEREEDWSIRNRVFMNEEEWAHPRTDPRFLRSLSPGGVEPALGTLEQALKYFNSLPWENNPYSACGRIGHALSQHILSRREEGKEPKDGSYYYVKELINGKFRPDKGYWGGQRASHANRADGVMKMLSTYVPQEWEIPRPKKIIDFILSGASEKKGFRGRHCSAFNQIWSLAGIRYKYPELADYRGAEIDCYTAMTFRTFLDNWEAEKLNFYRNNWGGKANNGVPLFMATLIIDLPIMRASAICNWREGPIVTRHEDGGIEVNPVIYQRKGHPFYGGG